MLENAKTTGHQDPMGGEGEDNLLDEVDQSGK